MSEILAERQRQVYRKGEQTYQIDCEKQSASGSVSQRACVFCGSRVVLYPIADALHIVHGPIGCASYTWDIRGSLSSGPELHRLSFSTDLRELDVVMGGEKKLYAALCELIDAHRPNAAFVYATCIVGIIGDDVDAVCKVVGSSFTAGSKATRYEKRLYKDRPPNVRFEGYRSAKEIAQEYRESDVFCSPSVFQEPFGNVNIEAMACGLPVVSTRVGAIPEVASEGGFLLVEPESALQLADALQVLIEDRDLRAKLAAEGLASFKRRFTWPTIVGQYREIEESLT